MKNSVEGKSEIDYKKILYTLIGKLTVCDHLGDVINEVDHAFEKLGLDTCDFDNVFNQVNYALERRGLDVCDFDEDFKRLIEYGFLKRDPAEEYGWEPLDWDDIKSPV